MIELHINLGSGEIYTSIVCNSYEIFGDDCVILKKERPTYEVFAEFKEEEVKEELLSDDEKETLQQMVNNINSWSFDKVQAIIIQRHRDGATVEVNFHGKVIYLGNIAVHMAFDNLKQDEFYTIEELGLEE